jgi:solute carrier family 25 (mitochondrial oxoglutarate transporter), member 11
MVKVRIQLLGNTPNVSRNPFLIARNIVKTSGIMGLYKGLDYSYFAVNVTFFIISRLDAGLVRQITYTTTRMGMFRVISDALKKDGNFFSVCQYTIIFVLVFIFI